MNKKTLLKLVLGALVLSITFLLGILYAFPKSLQNRDLEDKYQILKSYGMYYKNEVSVKEAFIENSIPLQPLMCLDNSLPTRILYKGFGNQIYHSLPLFGITFSGGSFDGLFYSVKVVDCKSKYFIEEKRGFEKKYFGPFYK